MHRAPMHFSMFVLAAVLSPATLAPIDCNRTGNANLTSIEVEAAGVDRMIGFRSNIGSYTIGTTAGVGLITVRAAAVSVDATVDYRLSGASDASGRLGIGGGEVDLTIPINAAVTLALEVFHKGALRTYRIEINPRCELDQCDDGNGCSTDTCNLQTSICEFSALADSVPCDGDRIVDGECNAERCQSTARLIDFESFTIDEHGDRFGDALDRFYEGFDFAYDDPNKVATSTCTTATQNPPTCWGSWAIEDVNDGGVPGADGSDNWLKARASGVGKGAKITNQSGFVFRSVRLFTRDRASFPAFREQITVTMRDIDGIDTSVVVDLEVETWIEVTAADLGIEGVTLRSMWFNAAGIAGPNSGKFGLDNLKIDL